MRSPTTPAATITSGSWSFLNLISRPSVTSAISTVGMSINARLPRTKAAPAIAPVAAVVTPSTNALRLGFLEKRRKYGAGMTVNR